MLTTKRTKFRWSLRASAPLVAALAALLFAFVWNHADDIPATRIVTEPKAIAEKAGSARRDVGLDKSILHDPRLSAQTQIQRLPAMPRAAKFRFLGDIRYEYGDMSDIPSVAVAAAHEIYDGTHLGVDFAGATADQIISVHDECEQLSDFFLVPLWFTKTSAEREYAGVAALMQEEENIVSIGVIRPGPSAHTGEMMSEDTDTLSEYPPVSADQALSLATATHPEARLQAVVLPCAGRYPITTPTFPFYRFEYSDGHFYVSLMDATLVTSEDLERFESTENAAGSHAQDTTASVN